MQLRQRAGTVRWLIGVRALQATEFAPLSRSRRELDLRAVLR